MSSHVHPDLMGAAGLESDLEQRSAAERLHRLVVGHRVLAGGGHGELPRMGRMAPDRSVDRAGERIGMTLDDRVIDLLDLTLLEGPLQGRVSGLRLRHDHEAARAHIQPVHDSLPFGRSARRDPEPSGCKRSEHRRPLPPDGWMRGDPRRLVDDHDVVVLEDDTEVGHCDRHDLRLPLVLPRDVEPHAGFEAIGLAERPTTRRDTARFGHFRREGAGEAEHLRQRGIHACALEPVRDGDHARRHVSPSPAHRIRRPSRDLRAFRRSAHREG